MGIGRALTLRDLSCDQRSRVELGGLLLVGKGQLGMGHKDHEVRREKGRRPLRAGAEQEEDRNERRRVRTRPR